MYFNVHICDVLRYYGPFFLCISGRCSDSTRRRNLWRKWSRGRALPTKPGAGAGRPVKQTPPPRSPGTTRPRPAGIARSGAEATSCRRSMASGWAIILTVCLFLTCTTILTWCFGNTPPLSPRPTAYRTP